LLLVHFAATAQPSNGKVGRWRSAAGKAAYEEAYARALTQLPTPTRVLELETSFGTVKAYQWVNDVSSGPPVVLVPGRSAGVPMWYANVGPILQKRTVWAFDAIGDAGLSNQTVALGDTTDQAAWLDEALVGAGIAAAHVVGHSFGASSAAALAVNRPERVASLTLLEPVFVLCWPPARTFFWATVASLGFLPKKWREAALARIGGEDPAKSDPNDPVARMIALGAEHYAAELPTPRPLGDEQLSALECPVYLAVGGQQSLAGGETALRRLRMAKAAEGKVYAGTTHSLPMQVPDDLTADLEAFWSSHESPE
jgi:pimeloyl-ACP methyl ester carboxylesterase